MTNFQRVVLGVLKRLGEASAADVRLFLRSPNRAVHRALYSLRKAGRVERVGPGRYREVQQ